ncbi:MAG: hypothetical protein PVI57_00195 [Gemmatimonadota bacterium]|jgi:hypothetical protein
MKIRASMLLAGLTALALGCGGADEADTGEMGEMESEMVDSAGGMMEEGEMGDTMMPDTMQGMPEEMMEDTTGGMSGGR